MLYTNPRGSTGIARSSRNEIKNAYPDKDFDDLMAGVDTVVGRGYVDTKNMFVYGCSGGGVAHGVDGRPHRSLRGGSVALPGDRLDQLSSARPTAPAGIDNFESRSGRIRASISSARRSCTSAT